MEDCLHIKAADSHDVEGILNRLSSTKIMMTPSGAETTVFFHEFVFILSDFINDYHNSQGKNNMYLL